MSILETLDDLNLWNIEILGTDIDKKALARAEKGLYIKKVNFVLFPVCKGEFPVYIKGRILESIFAS